MADEKIGADMLGDMASLGLQELQNANAGLLAPDSPPIPPVEQAPAEPVAQAEAPMIDQGPSYADLLADAASRGGNSGPDLGMSR
jgi:hypothetical protein